MADDDKDQQPTGDTQPSAPASASWPPAAGAPAAADVAADEEPAPAEASVPDLLAPAPYAPVTPVSGSELPEQDFQRQV